MGAWHTNNTNRKEHGLPLEKRFVSEFACSCGGRYKKAKMFWKSDLICENCGQRVEIKFSPQTERTGNIAVSANAWNEYSDDTIIVTNVTGTWYGSVKEEIEENCGCIDTESKRSSTHPDTGGYGGGHYDSSFYLIPVKSLDVIG